MYCFSLDSFYKPKSVVFSSKFDIFRPHIRGAIREYQNQLIHRVKEDIEKLHQKFKVQYQDSRAAVLSLGRDIPPVAGSIIWARQIEGVIKFELLVPEALRKL